MVENIKAVDKTLTNGQILDLANFIKGSYTQAGRTHTLSLLIAKNFEQIAKISNYIRSELYNQYSNESFVKYDNARNELINLYGDKDDNGKLIYDNNRNVMNTEKYVEFQEELTKLNDEYKSTIDEVTKKLKENDEVLSEKQVINIIVAMDYTLLPPDLEPIFYTFFTL